MPLESLRYSIPYISLILFFLLLFITEYQVRKQGSPSAINLQIIRWIALGVMLIFFGFRGFIGWDWTIYYPAFESIPPLRSLDVETFTEMRFEYGFIVYMSAIKSIWNNYHFFIFSSTLIDLLLLNAIFKQYSRISYSLSFVLFIVIGGFYLETDLLRSAKTIMLFLISLPYLKNRRILPFFIINLAGCLFHFSAVFFLPLYFFLHKTIPRRIVLTIFIIGLTIFIVQIEYVMPLLLKIASLLGEKFTAILNKYITNDLYSSGYGLTFGFIERIITSSLLIIYYKSMTKDNRDNILFINSFIVYFIFFFYFTEIKIIPVRVGGLFLFSYWMIYPLIYQAIENKNNKIIFLFYIFMFSIVKIIGMTNSILYRYINVIFGSDAFQSRLDIFESSNKFFLK